MVAVKLCLTYKDRDILQIQGIHLHIGFLPNKQQTAISEGLYLTVEKLCPIFILQHSITGCVCCFVYLNISLTILNLLDAIYSVIFIWCYIQCDIYLMSYTVWYIFDAIYNVVWYIFDAIYSVIFIWYYIQCDIYLILYTAWYLFDAIYSLIFIWYYIQCDIYLILYTVWYLFDVI